MRIGFIGAGKVGTTLGKYFVSVPTQSDIRNKMEKGQSEGIIKAEKAGSFIEIDKMQTNPSKEIRENFTLTGYYSRNPESAKEAADFTNSTKYDTLEQIIEDSDLLFLTVPDDAISTVWDSIKRLPIKEKIICHCSGSLSSAIFSGIESTGAYAYSIHPLFAISSKTDSYQTIQQAVFTMEGNEKHLKRLQAFLQSFGNDVSIVGTEAKTKYHAAAVMASNHVVALAQTAIHLLRQCGFSESSARKALGPLLCNNALSVSQKGPMEALTGPIERNDVGTVRKHLDCLDEDTKELYVQLSKILIGTANEKHSEWDYSEMEELLSK